MTKKFSSIALVGALTVAALVGVTAPAQAAAKANGACATPGAKATINKISYVCGQNPLVTATKNIWLRITGKTKPSTCASTTTTNARCAIWITKSEA